MTTPPLLAGRPSGGATAALTDSARWLPALLSVVAGMVDVIGYFSLGNLFTAHVTGNIVVIAASLVRGGAPNLAQVLALPVFIVAVAAVWLIAKASPFRGPALLRPLLVVQFLLLAIVLIVGVTFHVAASPNGWMTSVAAVMATSAMACQFALLRVAVPGAPSTAVMTGNLTNSALSALETLSSDRPLMTRDDERMRRTVTVLVGFFFGCVAGAGAVSLIGDWAWLLPVALAGVVAVVRYESPVTMAEQPRLR
jgi:uncharacterized membrane protein YoaK (UPF0700 family)